MNEMNIMQSDNVVVVVVVVVVHYDHVHTHTDHTISLGKTCQERKKKTVKNM